MKTVVHISILFSLDNQKILVSKNEPNKQEIEDLLKECIPEKKINFVKYLSLDKGDKLYIYSAESTEDIIIEVRRIKIIKFPKCHVTKW